MNQTENSLIVRDLGICEYSLTYSRMQQYTASRQPGSSDEIWNLEHDPVYTLGRAGKEHFLLAPGDIPVERVNRGGQVTYHGPGQLIQYLLLDLNSLGIGVRALVSTIETAIIRVLAGWNISAEARADAPGVYVEGAKIAALGLRISRGYSYHGLAFNVDMDMSPWAGIDACGLGVPVTQLSDLVDSCPDVAEVGKKMTEELISSLGYNDASFESHLP